MSTVPNSKLSHDSTWIVRPSQFPFGVSGAELGRVTGDTRESAQQKAEDHYGRGVVVQLASRLDLQTIAQTAPPSPDAGVPILRTPTDSDVSTIDVNVVAIMVRFTGEQKAFYNALGATKRGRIILELEQLLAERVEQIRKRRP